jgi:hypothetical protein
VTVPGVDAVHEQQWCRAIALLLGGRPHPDETVSDGAECLGETLLVGEGRQRHQPGRVEVDVRHSKARTSGQLVFEQHDEPRNRP